MPATDPKAVPSITSVAQAGYTVEGQAYAGYMLGTHLSIFCKIKNGDDWADRIFVSFDKTDFYWRNSLYFQATLSAPTIIYQPLGYEQQTVPVIIYSFAKWHASVVDIDSTSFSAVDTYCLGLSMVFSPIFYEDSALDIIRELCEASEMVFIFINNSSQLACGYLNHEPASADWIIQEDEIISVQSYGEMRERETPVTIHYGWDARHIAPQSPKFPWGIYDAGEPDGTAMKSAYDSRWADKDSASFWPGAFIDWADYVSLEIEVGYRALLWDIDDVVEVHHAALGLSQDVSYPDWFRVHKIVFNLMTMTAKVTLVKNKTWND